MTVKKLPPILAAGLVVLAGAAIAAGASSPGTLVTAQVAPEFSRGGLGSGDPLAGATLLLYDGNTVVYSGTLDADGSAVIKPQPGVYDVQVRLVSQTDSLCFWGDTELGVQFPAASVTLQAGFICAGS